MLVSSFKSLAGSLGEEFVSSKKCSTRMILVHSCEIRRIRQLLVPVAMRGGPVHCQKQCNHENRQGGVAQVSADFDGLNISS